MHSISNFQLISLVSASYKVVSKVLAAQLQKVMGTLVGPFQHAFIKGRQSFDVALIANEVVDSYIKSGEGGVICKLVMEKAHDHVSGDCLIGTITRVVQLNSLVHLHSILLYNDKWMCPRFFQGDALSLLLFILVMELLSVLMIRQEAWAS